MKKDEVVKALAKRLQVLQFDNGIEPLLRFYVKHDFESFAIPYRKEFGEDSVRYLLNFQKAKEEPGYRLEKYEATLKKQHPIPSTEIVGIYTTELEARMKKVDWTIDHHLEALYGFSTKDSEAVKQVALISGIMDDLEKLGAEGEEGEWLQAIFMYKFWRHTPFEMHSPSINEVINQQEWKTTIIPTFNITATEAYELLNGKFLTNKNTFFMNPKNFDFLKDQLKYTGFGEGLQDALKEKMQSGASDFTLLHSSTYGNDQTTASLFFKKSPETDMYFFNRYELALNNERLKEPMKQSFFVSAKADNITLKEGYNLLCGRAVYKEMSPKEGPNFNAWLQLDFREKLANGNYHVKQFHDAYGYKLEAALAKHHVKDFQTEDGKKNLMDSLQRGNRQSATMVTEVGTEKVFMEASPQFKSLNVYDSHGQRMRFDKNGERQSQGQGVKQDEQKAGKKQKPVNGSNVEQKPKRGKKTKQPL